MRPAPLAVVALALACRPSREQAEFRLRIALVGPLTPLTPGAEPSASDYAKEWVFESLLRTASDGSVTPGLASRLQFLTPSRVAIQLREGARFSDGSAVTAEDVRRSLADDAFDVHEHEGGLLIESRSGAAV
ncbi:MAG TPA: hypothetical protein VKC58_06115, partial [Myxococcales bacterium]|nr:hypothetical protein [Myxococcales bacterium]